MEHLRCVVERITYQNPQNGFTVLQCRAKAYADLVTVVGSMPSVYAGSVLNIEGFWKVDAKYGRQFTVHTYEEALPATVLGMEKFLGGGLIKGIGPALAKRIVQTFGKDTLNVIEEDIERLSEVEGIGKQRVERIRESWEEQREVKNICIFLQAHEVSTVHITKIYKAYGKDSIPLVKENPYRLADDIWGIGFKTADTIAAKLGFAHDAPARLRSGLLYTLNQLAGEGHCYATRQSLLSEGERLLEVEAPLLGEALEKMIMEKDVIIQPLPQGSPNPIEKKEKPDDPFKEQMAIYLPPFYYAEVGTVGRLLAISKSTEGIELTKEDLLEKIQGKEGISYDQVQLQAIQTAIESKILLLTGGPGTGKTTTTLGIIQAFQAAGASILLAAPTGRAAKRLSEVTGLEAMTIHRLLDYKPPQGYQKNEENPLQGDVLILDECSMIDLLLMYNLLKAVPDRLRLIFVGDACQLPSVGAGNVLKDLIDCGCFPVVQLKRIFRQAQTSQIIMNAHKINQGKQPDLSNPPNTDFFFLDIERLVAKKGQDPKDNEALAQEAVHRICTYVEKKLPRHYQVKPTDIQVLVPMQRSLVGASNLNQVLQSRLNPNGPSLKHAGVAYRCGDKVMQIRNNYEKEVFNGDIGVITSVDEGDRVLTVLFDKRPVSFEQAELDELVLAYATTIHKSQGSEYPIVVMPLLMNHFVMLQRNLVYTGVTRAKQALLVVGTRKALSYAIKNVTVTKRNTLLSERLKDLLPAYQESLQRAGFSLARQPLSRGEQVAEAPLTYGAFQEKNQEKCREKGQEKYREEKPKEEPKEAPHSGEEQTPKKRRPSREEWMRSLFSHLGASTFRSRFHLKEEDILYIRQRSLPELRSHAFSIIEQRLAPEEPKNDGKQTPMRGAPKGHPVFLAQHATATCCRSCLEKWHHIPKGRPLSPKQVEYVVDVIMYWIEGELKEHPPTSEGDR